MAVLRVYINFARTSQDEIGEYCKEEKGGYDDRTSDLIYLYNCMSWVDVRRMDEGRRRGRRLTKMSWIPFTNHCDAFLIHNPAVHL